MSWLTDRLGIHDGKIQVSLGKSRAEKETEENEAQRQLEIARAEALRLGLSPDQADEIGKAAYAKYRNTKKAWIEKRTTAELANGGVMAGTVLATAGGIVATFPGIGTVIGAAAMAAGAGLSAAGAYSAALEMDKKKMEEAYHSFQRYKSEMMTNPALSENPGLSSTLKNGETEFRKTEEILKNLRRKQMDLMLEIESKGGEITPKQNQEIKKLQTEIDEAVKRITIQFPTVSITGININSNQEVKPSLSGVPIDSTNPQGMQIAENKPYTIKKSLLDKIIDWFKSLKG